jgi:hypothetical protein
MSFMIALVVYGFFDTPYFKNDLAVIFWVLAGLLVVVPRVAAKDTTSLHIPEH